MAPRPLYMGICNKNRWEKAKKQIEERNKKHPGTIKHPVCTFEQALQNPGIQKHFMFQRAQISGYERQAKIANNKNVGNLVRDVKSLVVPYLFSIVNFKPNKAYTPSSYSSSSSSSSSLYSSSLVTLSEYAKASANANRYFVNKFAAKFNPDTRERGRRRRVIPFNRQLMYYWINNKSVILKDAMNEIHNDAESVFQTAIKYNKSNESVINKKKEAFKIAFEKYKQNRIKGRNYDPNSILNQNYEDNDDVASDENEGGQV